MIIFSILYCNIIVKLWEYKPKYTHKVQSNYYNISDLIEQRNKAGKVEVKKETQLQKINS